MQQVGTRLSVKIIQILNQDKTMVGLGDDGKVYRFNFNIRQWEALEAE